MQCCVHKQKSRKSEMCILSIQSHVVYGYVGNKAAVYPLQSMGYDTWPIHTVQFSNHTGYGKWHGEIFSANHIREIIAGLEELGVISKCNAVLSGYMGSAEICSVVQDTVKKLKNQNSNLIYLCDPVIGNNNCFVKPEVLDFFRTKLIADIITPNQFEAETLSGTQITDIRSLKFVANHFHGLGIKIVVITGIKSPGIAKNLSVFISDGTAEYIIRTDEYNFPVPINGTGDLFSAIYLGSYLAHNNSLLALQQTIYFMQQVLHNTFQLKEKELQVLSVKYDLNNIDIQLPDYAKI